MDLWNAHQDTCIFFTLILKMLEVAFICSSWNQILISVENVKNLKTIFNWSVLFFLNLNLIPSVKVSSNSDRLAESITDIINTLRLYTTCKD